MKKFFLCVFVTGTVREQPPTVREHTPPVREHTPLLFANRRNVRETSRNYGVTRNYKIVDISPIANVVGIW